MKGTKNKDLEVGGSDELMEGSFVTLCNTVYYHQI